MTRAAPDVAVAATSLVRARYRVAGGRTSIERIHEAGSLRLRHPRGGACEAVLVNTAGGVVAGDRLSVDVALAEGAAVALTGASAEKIYRSTGPLARIDTRLALAPASRTAWIPQETILFDGSRLRRRLDIDLAEDATLIAAEIVVFGRTASGERMISGKLHDSWRVRRAGELIFADETRLDGVIDATLARAAVARAACATALILVVHPDAARLLDPVRAAIDPARRDRPIEGGASLVNGLIVARCVAHASEPLRRVVAAVLGVVGGFPVPRVWQ